MNFTRGDYPGWACQEYDDFITWRYEPAEGEVEVHRNGPQTVRDMQQFAKRPVQEWEVWVVNHWVPIPAHIENIEEAMAWAIAIWRMS
jgi:hypothetical protein